MGLQGLLISLVNLLLLSLSALSWFYDAWVDIAELRGEEAFSQRQDGEDVGQEDNEVANVAVRWPSTDDVTGVSYGGDSAVEVTGQGTDDDGLGQEVHEHLDIAVPKSLETDVTDAYNEFKRRHWICPTQRPRKWRDWLTLMRERRLIPGRPRNTFIVARETLLKYIFTIHLGGNIFTNHSSLRVVDFKREDSVGKFIAYEGKADIEVALKEYLPIHFHYIKRISVINDVYWIWDNGHYERLTEPFLVNFSSRGASYHAYEHRVLDGDIYWYTPYRQLATA